MLSPEQKEAKKDRALKGIVKLATKAMGTSAGNGRTGRAKTKTTKARPKARRATRSANAEA